MKASRGTGTTGPEHEVLLEQMRHFCSYRERCSFETEQKILKLAPGYNGSGKILESLRKDHFLDDERFARLFVRSKFNINRWGRIRIRLELERRRIPGPLINLALQELSEEEYRETILRLAMKKQMEIKGEKKLTIRDKIFTFVNGKGFEPDLVLQAIHKLKL